MWYLPFLTKAASYVTGGQECWWPAFLAWQRMFPRGGQWKSPWQRAAGLALMQRCWLSSFWFLLVRASESSTPWLDNTWIPRSSPFFPPCRSGLFCAYCLNCCIEEYLVVCLEWGDKTHRPSLLADSPKKAGLRLVWQGKLGAFSLSEGWTPFQYSDPQNSCFPEYATFSIWLLLFKRVRGRSHHCMV